MSPSSLLLAFLLHLAVLAIPLGQRSEDWKWNTSGGPIWIEQGASAPELTAGGTVPAATAVRAGVSPRSTSLGKILGEGNARPEYPRLALERGWEGDVKIRVRFGSNGPEVELLESSENDLLDEAAIRAAKTWSLPHGLESNVAWIIPIPFRIQD